MLLLTSWQVSNILVSSRPMVFDEAAATDPVEVSEVPDNPTVTLPIRNTSRSMMELLRDPRAVLLENAVWDTRLPIAVDNTVPEGLKATADPGAYIVQGARGVDGLFRATLQSSGARIVSYIPNNAYLVRVSAEGARELRNNPAVGAVLAYEPIYKLKRDLLPLLLRSGNLRANGLVLVDVLLMAGTEDTFDAVAVAGCETTRRERSQIGTIVTLACPQGRLADLAKAPQVQGIQKARNRIPAMDRTRVGLGVCLDVTEQASILGLYGSNVVVGVADTGVDATHPDLSGRLLFHDGAASIDVAGHGTHIAGVIGGSGTASMSVSNVQGSSMPPVAGQFRGVAPSAKLFCLTFEGTNRPSDTDMQRAAAGTNVLVFNNSWVYAEAADYDFAAASYDAAAVDALPEVSGKQPVLFVFAAGNTGQANQDGSGGVAGTVCSPATAKNVLTVGALEQARGITNTVISCTGEEPNVNCVTNQPWLEATDNDGQVASFSSRGNVGIGMEGVYGRFKPDIVAPGTFVLSSRSSQFDAEAYFGGSSEGLVLSNLTYRLGGLHRFESGTSVAAAAAAGALGLIQEFFESRVGTAITPALLKALAIHGARIEPGFNLGVCAQTNSSGWGALDLAASLAVGLTNAGGATNSIFYDQQTSLGTGEQVTRIVRVIDPEFPLKATLVWTDPPGNPMAAVKLVNNLDLVITNLDTGEVYLGNDIDPESRWSSIWNSSAPSLPDCVNNVERVLISPPLGTNYSVTVRARGINVDCGSGRFDVAAQRFALAISAGSADGVGALALQDTIQSRDIQTAVTVLTNTFESAQEFGVVLRAERFGAHNPGSDEVLTSLGQNPNSAVLVGQSNQWRFYIATNLSGFNHAAFVLFDPAGLSPAPVTTLLSNADLDLYVSMNPLLLELDPSAFGGAWRSTGDGGEEVVVIADAQPGPYYIAVKCESPYGGTTGIGVFFSQQAFWDVQADGGFRLRGVPSPGRIAGSGEGSESTEGLVFGVPPEAFRVRRVVASNVVSHAQLGDVRMALSHAGREILLKDFSNESGGTLVPFVFDDSGELDQPGAIPSGTEGGLLWWNGRCAPGAWIMRFESRSVPGTNHAVFLTVYPQSDQAFEVLPGAERVEYFEVLPAVTNILLEFQTSSGAGPVWVEASPVTMSVMSCNQALLPGAPGSLTLGLDAWSDPPGQPGLWRARLRNDGMDPAVVSMNPVLAQDPGHDPYTRVRMGNPRMIIDDGLTVCDIPVTNLGAIHYVEAGIRAEHGRLGDLAFTLKSPTGTRVPLQWRRGGLSTNGMGCDIIATNIFPVDSAGGWGVASNTLNLKKTSGVVALRYSFWDIPDWMQVYYETNLIFDSGLTSGSGETNITYGPGQSTALTVVMNEGDNSDPETAWFYSLSSTAPDYGFLTFSDLFAEPRVKFAVPPFNCDPQSGAELRLQPEARLSGFAGEPAAGVWRLEIEDGFGGPQASGQLVGVELAFILYNPVGRPLQMSNAAPLIVSLSPLQTRWIEVQTSLWTQQVTNCITGANLPLTLFFSTNTPGEGMPPDATPLLVNVQAGCVVLDPFTAPSFIPGSKIYFALQNTNSAFVNVSMEARLMPHVEPLVNSVVRQRVGLHEDGCDFYKFIVSKFSQRVRFLVQGLTGDAALLARRGLPLPDYLTFEAKSDDPGSEVQCIDLKMSDVPVVLAPGTWFLAVTNKSGVMQDYQIQARQWLEPGDPIVLSVQSLTEGLIYLSWNSLPGVQYRVFTCSDMGAGVWTDVSGLIIADSYETVFSASVGPASEYFRVLQEAP